MSEPLVEVVRGPLVDAIHRGDLAVVAGDGTLVASVGDPRARVAYWRSSAKPFQAMPLVYGGAATHWELGDDHLAVACGSHSGEPAHTERVASLLGRIGCAAADLACGAHPPLYAPAADRLVADGRQPSPLHHNCSGVHAGMLALARHGDLAVDGYEQPSHPVQAAVVANVARFTGLAATAIVIGVDGCNAPTHGLSVYHMALAYARLMAADELGEPYAGAAAAIRAAMTAHPYLVGGTDRFDTDVMTVTNGAVVAKGGASGVACMGLEGGIGLALKIDDGAGPHAAARPTSVAAVAALCQLGVLTDDHAAALRPHARPVVSTTTGQPVGEARPVFDLDRRSSG